MTDHPRFIDASICLYLCNRALSEIEIFSHPLNNKEELHFVNMLSFSRLALLYCYNSEYCKLLEPPNPKYPTNHSASLVILNNIFKKELGDKYQNTFEENEILLLAITSSEYYRKARELRNTLFAHKDENGVPSNSIKGLADDKIETGIEHLKMLFKAFNKSGAHFNVTYQDAVPYKQTRTANFIRNHAKYQKFYQEHRKL